jgi:hypothetical protein
MAVQCLGILFAPVRKTLLAGGDFRAVRELRRAS